MATKLLISSVCETAPKLWAQSRYQDLSKRHDWPVTEKKIVNLPVSLKGNSKLICGKIVDMSPLEAQNKDIDAV